MIEYTIHKQTDKTVEVIIIDSETGITHNRVINIGDCNTQELLDERIKSHLRAFKHRVIVGAITESSIPTPTEVVIDPNLSKESKLALATVIEAKATEQKTTTEQEITRLNKEKKKDQTAIDAANIELQKITTAIESVVVAKTEIEKEV